MPADFEETVVHTDYSLLYMFFAAALAVAGVAAYEWWRATHQPRPQPGFRDYYTEGLKEMLAGRPREAVVALTEAVRSDSDHIDAYLQLATCLRHLGRARRAAQIHIELSIRSDLPPYTLANIFRELALDFEQLGSLEKAFRYLDKSRQLDPANAEDLAVKLRLLERQGKWKEAGDVLRKFASLSGKPDPQRLALYKIEEGHSAADEGKEHDARVVFKEALKTDADAIEAMLCIASSYIREERRDDAFEWLTKFIKEHPDRAQDALPLLESLLFDLGRFGEIETILKAAAAKAPANVNLAHALIEIAVKKGEFGEALELCGRALEASPGAPALKLRQLALMRRRGESAEFDRELEELVDRLTLIGQGYYCFSCGRHSDLLRTRCPSCGNWRSFAGERRRA